jgi:tyrosine-protein kinase Etk/Wzc
MTKQIPTTVNAVPPSDDIELGYLLALIQDYKIPILIIALITTLAGAAHAWLATPVYQADALLQVENRSSTIGGIDLLPMGQEQSTTQTEILRSRMIMGQAALQAGLEIQVQPVFFPVIGPAMVRNGTRRPGFAQNWSSVWADEFIEVAELRVPADLIGAAFTIKAAESGSYLLLRDGEVLGQGRVGSTLVVDVEAQTVELFVAALEAAPGAEFVVRRRSEAAMVRYLQNRFNAASPVETGIIRLTLTGPDGEELVRSLDAIADVYLLQNINRQSAEAESRLSFLEAQTPLMLEDLTQAEDVLNDYKASQDSVDLDFETRTLLERLVSLDRQLNELEFQESELAQRFTLSHPSYQTLVDKKLQLQKESAEVEAQVNELPGTQRQVLRLNRDVVVGQQIYMQMLNNMQELRIARAGNIGNVRILDRAVVQSGMIAPNKPLIIVVSMFTGVFLGFAVVLLRHILNRGVESIEQLQEAGLPVYAAVPLSSAQTEIALNTRLDATGKKRRPAKNADSRLGLLALIDPADMAIEALRSLRTSLHFAMLEAPNNRLMLAGASPAVGKSFVSTNLAALCAQSGQKVLLIDADLRKGHIHRVFKDKNVKGLSDFLADKLDLESAIRKTEQPGLDYIARGSISPNPSELLMSERFTDFLAEVSKRYELVIIDTPPALAVTDAAIVGKQVGTTLLVVRFRTNSPKEVARTMQQFESGGVLVKGAVLNAIERTATAYYGYGYGYGYYHYAYKSDSDDSRTT